MDENIIRFPTERRITAQAQAVPAEGAAVPMPEPTAVPGEPYALLSLEVRRLPRTDSRVGADAAGRILNRAVLASLEILSKERAPVDLAGTVLRPVLEAAFAGPDGVTRAARAALAIKEAVRKVQRELENEFHVFGAITAGNITELEGGVKVTTGSAEQVAARFREHAAPGQVLLSEAARELADDAVEVDLPALPITLPGAVPVDSYVLSALK